MNRFLFSCTLLVLLGSCAIMKTTNVQSPKRDIELVGSWSGSEKNNQAEGLEKHWIQHRFEDGRFVILYISQEDCELFSSINTGEWWTENGIFYEKFDSSQKIDSYEYEFISSTYLKFKAHKLSSQNINPDYVFIEKKEY